jgi:hypothetical protein
MPSSVTDGELNELTTTLLRATDLKLVNSSVLKDGRYFQHQLAISAKNVPKWVLSIYRNVIETDNDLEIAIDAWPLVWPNTGPDRYRAALRWLEHQRELEHLPSGVHATQPPAVFRIGLKLDGAKEFVQRLQQQLEIRDVRRRWQLHENASTPVPRAPMLPQQAPLPADPILVVVEQMLRIVHQICAQSGSQSVVTTKVKQWRFDSDDHFRDVIHQLLAAQRGHCKLTGVAMDMTSKDGDLAPSLDRIDSNGHYEPSNLQVVARFANRWKSDDTDANFHRLLTLVKC